MRTVRIEILYTDDGDGAREPRSYGSISLLPDIRAAGGEAIKAEAQRVAEQFWQSLVDKGIVQP